MKNKYIVPLILFLCHGSFCSAQLTMSLSLNNRQTLAAYRDQPLLVSVGLSNEAAEEQATANDEARRYLQRLQEEYNNKEIEKDFFQYEQERIRANIRPVDSVVVGNATAPWFEQIRFWVKNMGTKDTFWLEVIQCRFPEPENPVVLNAESFASATFGIPGGRLAPGKYQLRAYFQNRASEPVKLEIAEAPMPEGGAGSLEMLIYRVKYFQYIPDYPLASAVLQQLMESFPDKPESHIAAAEVFCQQEMWVPARTSYEKALELWEKQDGAHKEPPRYLLAMIAFCKGKM